MSSEVSDWAELMGLEVFLELLLEVPLDVFLELLFEAFFKLLLDAFLELFLEFKWPNEMKSDSFENGSICQVINFRKLT